MFSRVLLTFFLFAALAIPSVACAGYQEVLDASAVQTRLAARSIMNGVALAGGRLICVGQRGSIVYSDDRGRNWRQARVPVQSDLTAVSFPTAKSGWAVGHDGVVLHSADGGASWAKQLDGRAAAQVMAASYPAGPIGAEAARYLQQGADKPFLDVFFESESVGYVVGAFNLIFRTSDGGKSWVPLFDKIDNPQRLHLYGIRPIGPDLFVSGEQGSLFKLDRQTGRFKALHTPYKGTFFGVAGRPGAIVAYGMRGNAFRSRDAGASWQKVETGVAAGLTGGTVTPEGKIVLVSQAGDVLLSSDGAASFTALKMERPFPATAVTAVDAGTVALAGFAGMKLQALSNSREN